MGGDCHAALIKLRFTELTTRRLIMLKKSKKAILILLILVSVLSTISTVSLAAEPDITKASVETAINAGAPFKTQSMLYMGLYVFIPQTALADGYAYVVVTYLDANGFISIWGGSFTTAGIAYIPIIYQTVYNVSIT
jgi:hypothetical protein